MSLLLANPWTGQPPRETPLTGSLARGLVLLAHGLDRFSYVDATIPNLANAVPGILQRSAMELDARSSRWGQVAGRSQTGLGASAYRWPRSELNALWSSSGAASCIMLLRSNASDSTGNKGPLILQKSGSASAEHYPFTDGKIYIGPFSTTRWVSAYTPPSGAITSPHVIAINHSSGSQEFWFNGALAATGSVAETPQISNASNSFEDAQGANGAIYLAAFYNRRLTPNEIISVSAYPWQLFFRLPRRILVPGAAGATAPTLSAATYATLTSTTVRPRVTVTF